MTAGDGVGKGGGWGGGLLGGGGGGGRVVGARGRLRTESPLTEHEMTARFKTRFISKAAAQLGPHTIPLQYISSLEPSGW